jgi:hypothetical protein
MRFGSRLFVFSLGTVFACGAAQAQVAFATYGEYAQFRNLSGLSGGGYGVDRDGRVTLKGAFSFSTPVAYSLGHGEVSLTLANTSFDNTFRFFEKEKQKDFGFESNGTGSVNVGLETSLGNITLGMVVVSGSFENAYSFLWTPKQGDSKVTLGFGAQGLFSAGGFVGPGLASNSADRSTSVFGVATWKVDDRMHISAGMGTSRFRKGFGNISYGFTDGIKGFAEYDGFDWNVGAGFNLGSMRLTKDRTAKFTGTLALVARKYAAWSINISF